ncbi:MAG: MerR family transcriptional regulator [Deltaproteobacteria bacterium]|nr:MerR family transcriptional regulator [Deltaproteobacteria bacterium]
MKSEHHLDNLDEDASGGLGLYPMRLVARMTGLSAATIRAWERRYGAIEPSRTDGNTRLFSAADVRRLSLLREATERGHAIGVAARLDEDALHALLQPPVGTEPPTAEPPSSSRPSGVRSAYAPLCDAYLHSVDQYEARRSHEILLRAAALLPGREFVMEVVLPVLREVGLRWEAGRFSVAHEHMVSAQLTAVLGTLRQVTPSDRGAPRIVVAAPEAERHEFGVLVGALLAAARGLEPIYLGADLPMADIERAATVSRCHLVLLGVARDLEPATEGPLAASIENLARNHRTWIGCPARHSLVTRIPGARFFHDFEALDLALVHVGTHALSG